MGWKTASKLSPSSYMTQPKSRASFTRLFNRCDFLPLELHSPLLAHLSCDIWHQLSFPVAFPLPTEFPASERNRKYISAYQFQYSSVHLLSGVLTLCNAMNCSTPGLPVHHQLPELAQTHVHLVGDAIHPSYPLSSPSSPAFNLSQHQGLFQ